MLKTAMYFIVFQELFDAAASFPACKGSQVSVLQHGPLACVLVQSYDMNTTGHLCNKKLLAACMESQRDRLCQGSQLVCWHGWCKAWRVSQDPKEQAEVCRNDLTLIDLDLQCT